MKGVWWMLRFDARLRVDTIAPDEYFPAANAHATWQRREPFFKLSGRVPWEPERVQVELRQFTDRHLNRDLAALYRWGQQNRGCRMGGNAFSRRVVRGVSL
jgi:hypothetical protein